MNFKINGESSRLFLQVQEVLFNDGPEVLYIVFNMGSTILDTSNQNNYVLVHADFIEVYNDDTKELTFMRNSEIKGFIFENKPKV